MRRPSPATALVAALSLSFAPWPPAAAATSTGDGSPVAGFALAYTADVFHNARGGLAEGTAYLDYAEFSVAADASGLTGISNLALFASIAHANRTTFSDRYPGDAMVVSGIDADRAPGVLEAWVDWGFRAGGPASLRVGLYDLNSEFDLLEASGLFLNSAYGIGQDIAQTGANGPSLFPTTSLGARLAWAPRESWSLKLAVLDAVPGDPEDRGHSRLHLSSREGALWVTEAQAGGPQARVTLGYWRYGAEFADQLVTDADGTPQMRNDNAGGYVGAEFASRRTVVNEEPRWAAFARAGTAEDRINVFDRYLAAGVVLRSAWPGRNGSFLGLAAAEARVGDAWRERRARAGLATEPCERNVELTWRVPLTGHVVLQPDLQYVVNPGADPALRNALVIGLRVELFLAR